MKKAQMEIMGLAILIILVIVGMTFVIRFMAAKEPAEHKKQFTNKELASNMINTFLKSTSNDCNDMAMNDLLQDCAQTKSIYCGSISSCDYIRQEAEHIFGETLKIWKVNYAFKAFQNEEKPLFALEDGECRLDKESESFPIPTS